MIKTRPKRSLLYRVSTLFLSLFLVFSQVQIAQALPSGWQIIAGNVIITPDGQILNINIDSHAAIINWDSFDTMPQEIVNFFQLNSDSIALNRVTSGDPTTFLGTLNANGNIFLINQSGILFGAGSQVNVGGLVASTLDMSNQNFLAGNYVFERGNADPSSIVNQGTIDAGHFAAFLSNEIRNEGIIRSHLGSVAMGAGDKMTLSIDPQQRIAVVVDEASSHALINNLGTIQANGGHVYMTAETTNGMLDRVINNEGVIEAHSVQDSDGVVQLMSDTGQVRNGGMIDVSSYTDGVDAGSVIINAERIINRGTIKANAADNASAGYVELVSNSGTMLTTDSRIEAKGKDVNSTGGEVYINTLNGNTYVRSGAVVDISGGTQSGNAGSLEISASGGLSFHGILIGNAAEGYLGGRAFFDPRDIRIFTGGSDSVAGGDSAAGTPDEAFDEHSGLDITFDPATAFPGFSEIYLQATRDITVDTAWTASTSIKLEAGRNIAVNENITVTGGGNTLTLTADAAFTGLPADGTGTVTVASGKTLTSTGAISVSGGGGTMTLGAITSSAGGVTIDATRGGSSNTTGAVTLNGAITSNGVTSITANNGIAVNESIGVTSGNLTLSADADVATSPAGTVTVASGKTLSTTTSGAISIDGSGDATLRAITSAGTLSIGTSANGSFGSLALSGNISAAGTTIIESDGNITSTGTITTTSSGNLTITADQELNGTGTFSQAADAAGLITSAGTTTITGGGGTLTLGRISSTGALSVSATNGGTANTTGAIDTSSDTIAATGNSSFTANNGITFDNDVTITSGNLTINSDNDTATTSGGTVTVANEKTLKTMTSGNISIDGSGDAGFEIITSAGTLTIGGTTAFNAITFNDAATGITATGASSITAKNGITFSNATGDMTITSGTLTINADSNGDDTGTFTQSSGASITTSTSGNVSISAASAVLDAITSAGTIAVTTDDSTSSTDSRGAITSNGGTLTAASGSTTSLTGSSIGTSSSQIAFATAALGSSFDSTGGLHLKYTGGSIDISDQSSASSIETLTTGVGSMLYSTTGDLTLNASSAESDITVSGSMTSKTINGANVTLIAADDIGDSTNALAVNQTGTAKFQFSTGDVIISGVSASGTTTTITTSGNGKFSYKNDKSLNLTLDAGDLTTTSSTALAADALTVSAKSIGASGNALVTTATSMTLASTAGSMWVEGTSGVNVTSATATGGSINIDSTTNNSGTATFGALSGSTGVNLGNTSSKAFGTITLNGAVTGSDSTSIKAANGVTVNQDITITGANLAINSDSDASGAGTLTIASGKTLSTITSGNITLDGNGSATLGAITSAGAVTIGNTTAFDSLTLSGAITATGNSIIKSDGDMTVSGNVTVTSGSLTMTADNDANDSGAFSQASGTTISNTGGSSTLTINGGTIALTSVTSGQNIVVDTTNGSSARGAITMSSGTLTASSGTISMTGSSIGTSSSLIKIATENASNSFDATGSLHLNYSVDNDAIDISNQSVASGIETLTSSLGILKYATTGDLSLQASGSNSDITGSGTFISGSKTINGNNVTLISADDIGSALSPVAVNQTGTAKFQFTTGAVEITDSTSASGTTTTIDTTGNGRFSYKNDKALTIQLDGGALTTLEDDVNLGATTLTLSGTSIGATGARVLTSADTLSLTASGGSIFVTEASGVTVSSATATGGGITLTTGGTATLTSMTATGSGSSISVTSNSGDLLLGSLNGSSITLTASGGSILNNSGGGTTNLTSGGDATLSAQGSIGDAFNGLSVSVGGALNASASGLDSRGISINIDGTVGNGNQLTLTRIPPGFVLFNKRFIHTGVTADAATQAYATLYDYLITNADGPQKGSYVDNIGFRGLDSMIYHPSLFIDTSLLRE